MPTEGISIHILRCQGVWERSLQLLKQDIKDLLRLVAQTAEVEPEGPPRCKQMMGGLCKLTNGSLSFDLTLRPSHGNREFQVQRACIVEVHGSAISHSRRDGNDFSADGALFGAPDPVIKSLIPIVSRITKVPQFSNMPTVGTLTVQTLLGPKYFIYSTQVDPLEERVHLLGVGRAAGAEAPSARDVLLVELMHGEVARLCHGAPVMEKEQGATLPPYLQRIVPELLAGHVEKQIAANLGFTFNTTHQYIKAIYRHMGVSSRAEFMAHFLGRAQGWAKPTQATSREMGQGQWPSSRGGQSVESCPDYQKPATAELKKAV